MAPRNRTLFCAQCTSISIDTLSAEGGIAHADNAEQGCELCRDLRTRRELWHKANFRLVWSPQKRPGSKFRNLGVWFDGGESEVVYPLFTNEGDPASRAGVRVLQKPEPPTSKKCYETAKAWIQECTSHHDCSRSSTTCRAARLLDLGAFGSFPEADSRLVDTCAVPPASDYATLSYCWGSGMPPGSTTTTSNLASRYERIATASLPQTIRDAFTVVRTLGMRYLWIDALCIVQDSAADWAAESAKMAAIYSSGAICIAAQLAASCDAGFLSPPFPEEDNACAQHMLRIANRLTTGEDSTLYLWVRAYCQCFVRDTISGLAETPLSKRAWAYQERFLAPRILHFAGAQVLWECRERQGIPLEADVALRDVETLHRVNQYAPVARTLLDTAVPPVISSPLSVGLAETAIDRLRKLWYNDIIEEEFSSRGLTVASDKLPAISGVAREFGRRLEGLAAHFGRREAYVAGAWMGDILYALSWNPHHAARRPDTYRAPSWSWACTDGKVVFQYAPGLKGLTPFVELQDWVVTYPEGGGDDAFGGITFASVNVRGFIGWGVAEGGDFGYYRCLKSERRLGHAAFDDERVSGRSTGWRTWYMPVWATRTHCFVLLLKETDSPLGTYHRVGCGIGVAGDFSFMTDEWLQMYCERRTVTLV